MKREAAELPVMINRINRDQQTNSGFSHDSTHISTFAQRDPELNQKWMAITIRFISMPIYKDPKTVFIIE